jgi:hypothetical protein
MRNAFRLSCAAVAVLFAAALPAAADRLAPAQSVFAPQMPALVGGAKAVSTQTLGSRGTVTPSATLFGGFEIRAQADVYILVRGNSLGTLGVTQAFLDAPRVRLFTGSGQDIVTDSFGRAGFNACTSGSVFTDPVINYYTNVRGQAPHARDACVALNLAAGVYTFTVTPSIVGVTTDSGSSNPSSGEVLFEVTLAP